jgi:hypothetical protein
MVHPIPGKRTKAKRRGRSFPPNNHRGKPKNDVLAHSGHESSISGGSIAPPPLDGVLDIRESHLEVIHEDGGGIKLQLDKETAKLVADEQERVRLASEEAEKIAVNDLKLIDSIEFTQGANKLKITLSKKRNRMFRVQIFLNDVTEVRPVTYTGSAPAMTFWKLLKGSLK